MTEDLRLLLLLDQPADTAHVVQALQQAGFTPEWQCVHTELDFRAALATGPDIIIADDHLGSFNVEQALDVLQARTLDVPCIVISAVPGEDRAVARLKQGAIDYLRKDGLSRLGPAVRHALEQQAHQQARDRAAATLLARGAWFRALLENSTDGIVLVDPAGTRLYASPATAAILGYSVEEFLRGGAFDQVHPEDLAGVQEQFARLLTTPGGVACVAARLHHQDGSWLWVEHTSRNLLADPHIRAITVNYRDITARKQAETAIQRHTLTFETIHDAILFTDLAGRIIDCNPAAEQVSGYAKAELVGQSTAFLHIGVEPPEVRAGIRQELQRSGRWAGERRFQRKDGTTGVAETVLAVLRDPQGMPFAVLSSNRDITARQQAEAALHLSDEILQRVNALVLVADQEGRIQYVSPAVTPMLGYQPHELLGEGWWRVSRLNAGEADEEIARLRQAVLQKGNAPGDSYERRVLARDGTPRWILWQDGPGPGDSIIGVGHDITERRLAAEQSRTRARQQAAVADLGQQALGGTDLHRLMDDATLLVADILAVDFCAILERLPTSLGLLLRAGVGWPPALVGLITVGPDQESQAGYTLNAHGPVVMADLRSETRFREARLAELGIISGLSVVIHGTSSPYGVLGVHTRAQRAFGPDDTNFLQAVANVLALAIERRQSEEARLAQEAAERASRTKSEFLSRISHELRTPLNAILGFSQLLEMDDLDTKQQESVTFILKAGRHLLALINEVLEISRIESGRLALFPEAVSVVRLLEECIALVQPMAREKHLVMRTTLPDPPQSPTGYVWADPQRIKQVLLNLLSNAIKYNRVGGSVVLSYQQQDSGRLRIEVRDTGIGIAAQQLAKLFNPFERLDADQTSVEGTGLGLALSRGLVELMEGTLAVESVVGHGSIFWLDLPVAPAPVERLSPDLPRLRTLPPAAADNRTLLYIEDNLSNLRLVEQILKLRSHITVVSAMQGRLGFDLATQHRPDLILLDLHLPDVHGAKVLEWLQADPRTRDLPVVIVSADATSDQVARLLQGGARAYLTKPLALPQFLAVVDRNLGVLPQLEIDGKLSCRTL